MDIIAEGSATALLSVGLVYVGRGWGHHYGCISECQSVVVSVLLLNPKVLEWGFKTFWNQITLLETKSPGSFIQKKSTQLSMWGHTSGSVCNFRESLGGPEAHPQTLLA